MPRPEDHWPPLYSVLILPFLLLLGKTALAAKLPSIIILSILLPVLVDSLTRRIISDWIAAFGVALTVMSYPQLFYSSLFCWADVAFAFLVCFAAFLAIGRTKNGRGFLLAGIILEVSF